MAVGLEGSGNRHIASGHSKAVVCGNFNSACFSGNRPCAEVVAVIGDGG